LYSATTATFEYALSSFDWPLRWRLDLPDVVCCEGKGRLMTSSQSMPLRLNTKMAPST
jgi:hypothetical protein